MIGWKNCAKKLDTYNDWMEKCVSIKAYDMRMDEIEKYFLGFTVVVVFFGLMRYGRSGGSTSNRSDL